MGSRNSCALLAAVFLVGISGCQGKQEPSTRVVEGSTVPAPGLERVRIRFGNLSDSRSTGTFVEITILGPDGAELVGQRTATAGESVPFRFEGEVYHLEIVELEDHLTRFDYVSFRVKSGGTIQDRPFEVDSRCLTTIDAPGLKGRVRIAIGDMDEELSGTVVPVTILAARGGILAKETPLHLKEPVRFEVEGTKYRLEVLKLEYHTMSNCYVTLRVQPESERGKAAKEK